jgi:rhodanese-related sulfurtransferase
MNISQLSEFITNHPWLILAAVALTAMLIGGELKRRLSGVRDVAPGEATRLLNHENAIMIDMRSDRDFRDGHIVNAVHAPADNSDMSARLEKYRDRPLIVYCRSGQRSMPVCSKLRKQGFEKVYNLKGGVLGWQQADLPISKGK